MKRTRLSILFAMLATASVAQQEAQYLFAIYITETSSWNAPTNADRIKLTPVPILTDKDLIAYDWATHTMTISTNATPRLPSFGYGLQCSNFVVVAEGKRCYVGSFCGQEDCAPPPIDTPLIRVWSSAEKRLKTVILPINIAGRGRPMMGDDPRSDQRVRMALKKSGKLTDKNQEHPNQVPEDTARMLADPQH